MECVMPDFYDLEEGEIPEYDLVSPESSPKSAQEPDVWEDYPRIYRKEVYFGNAEVTHKSRSRHYSKRKKDRYLDRIKLYDKYRKHSRKNAIDFDEARRNLLEKLKKQQEKERLQKLFQFPIQSDSRTSETEEVDMLVDDTTCTDKSDKEEEKNFDSEEKNQESSEKSLPTSSKDGEDDEMDLVKLRLTALASNKKKPKLKNSNEDLSSNACDEVEDQNDLDMAILDYESMDKNDNSSEWDRTELLLRAEALKTALLKKHQKRMMKLKTEKGKVGAVSSEIDDTVCPFSAETAHTEENLEKSTNVKEEEQKGSESNLKFDTDAFKENVQEADVRVNSDTTKHSFGYPDLVSGSGSKKTMLRARGKKKRKKSNSLVDSLKENGKSEAGEEDDRTLRSQLLCDLLKKKPANDAEKKSVLLDSVQTGINRPAMLSAKHPPAFSKNPSLKKVNVNTNKKLVVAAAPAPVIPKADIQRIIIHLGSEDSSDDDFDVPGSEQSETAVVEKESEEKKCIATESTNTTKQAEESLQASYERSVELLLSQARKKIEGEKLKANCDHLATPEAVYKHLPPSQRLEYIRLKQKIAERERLKNLKTQGSTAPPSKPDSQSPADVDVNRTGVPAKQTIVATPLRSSVPSTMEKTIKTGLSPSSSAAVGSASSSPVRGPVKTVSGSYTAKGNAVRPALNSLSKKYVSPATRKSKTFPSSQQVAVRSPSTQILLAKVKLFLKKIKIEKTIEKNYDREIVKLKNQLNLFEKKKNEQRVKVKRLSEEITKMYRSIEAASRVGQKPTTSQTAGKIPTAGDKGKDGGTCERSPVEDKSETAIIEKDNGTTKEIDSTKDAKETPVPEPAPPAQKISEYNSPLQAFAKVSNGSSRVDPNVEMCQFDLMGVCKDEDCSYQHVRSS